MRPDNICYQFSVLTHRRNHAPGTLFVLTSYNHLLFLFLISVVSDFCCLSFGQPLQLPGEQPHRCQQRDVIKV